MKLTLLDTFDAPRFFLIVFLAVLGGASPAVACEPVAGNEYEKVYCQLKRSGRGESLPSLHDFRKNPPLMQALLLKKPAERAGIPLRIPERGNAETVDQQLELLLTAPPPTVINPTRVGKPAFQQVTPPPQAPVIADLPASLVALPPVSSIENCQLREFELWCADARYRLVTNQINQHLEEGVLSHRHLLKLPSLQASRADKAERERYLQQAYTRYIEGMMEIGLGAATMSYTKFVSVYRFNVSQHLDFVERFEKVYAFQKKEKASIGISTRPAIAPGFTTRYCSELKPELLACEHGKENYLFVKW